MSMRYRKNGAPMKAVRMPIGISAVVAVRETLSTMMRNVAPKSMEAGREYVALLPVILRAMCGTMRPTQPICPDTATALAVMRVLAPMATDLRSLVFTPRLLASSSDRDRMFSFQETNSNVAKEMAIGIAMTCRSWKLHPAKEPMRK